LGRTAFSWDERCSSAPALLDGTKVTAIDRSIADQLLSFRSSPSGMRITVSFQLNRAMEADKEVFGLPLREPVPA